MPAIPFALLGISFLFGFLGRDKKMGFWGYFFATMMFTPFIGAILLLVSDKRKTNDTNAES